jgi:hypothetical protein
VIRITTMIKLRHQQPSLWHRGLAEDIEGLWEPWMRLVDELLAGSPHSKFTLRTRYSPKRQISGDRLTSAAYTRLTRAGLRMLISL